MRRILGELVSVHIGLRLVSVRALRAMNAGNRERVIKTRWVAAGFGVMLIACGPGAGNDGPPIGQLKEQLGESDDSASDFGQCCPARFDPQTGEACNECGGFAEEACRSTSDCAWVASGLCPR